MNAGSNRIVFSFFGRRRLEIDKFWRHENEKSEKKSRNHVQLVQTCQEWIGAIAGIICVVITRGWLMHCWTLAAVTQQTQKYKVNTIFPDNNAQPTETLAPRPGRRWSESAGPWFVPELFSSPHLKHRRRFTACHLSFFFSLPLHRSLFCHSFALVISRYPP